VPTVDQLLASPALRGLGRVNDAGGAREIRRVGLAEVFADLERAPAASLVVLTRALAVETSDYRMDVALRAASSRGVAAVAAISEQPWRLPATAVWIADRADIGLIWVPLELELAQLLRALDNEIGGGPEQALARARSALAAIRRAETTGGDVDALVEAVATELGVPVTRRAPDPREISAPLVLLGQVEGHLSAPDVGGDLATVTGLVVGAAAAAASRMLEAARLAREVPIRSRSELLGELLTASDPNQIEDLTARARLLGLRIDQWHVALRIEADNLDQVERDEVARYQILEVASRLGLQAAVAGAVSWHLARVPRALVLVRMMDREPDPDAARQATEAGERALRAIGQRFPALRLRCGVGSPHQGALGLRATVAEARSALVAGRVSGRRHPVTAFDSVGLHRMLLEWYATEGARALVQDQLAPLERLGPRAEVAIRTLKTYLDEQGSIVRTARALNLHRNAVAYRVRRIFELLDVDPDDPDHRLALQLACRARLLN
jgi:sugar diacid utilization regulator